MKEYILKFIDTPPEFISCFHLICQNVPHNINIIMLRTCPIPLDCVAGMFD